MSFKKGCFDDCSEMHLKFKELVEALGHPSISSPFLAMCLKIHVLLSICVLTQSITNRVSIQHCREKPLLAGR